MSEKEFWKMMWKRGRVARRRNTGPWVFWVGLTILLLFLFLTTGPVWARSGDGQEGLPGLEDFDLSGINRFLDGEEAGAGLTIETVMALLADGNLAGLCRETAQSLKKNAVFRDLQKRRFPGTSSGAGLYGGRVYEFFHGLFRQRDLGDRIFYYLSADVYLSDDGHDGEHVSGRGGGGICPGIYEAFDAFLFYGGGICRRKRVGCGHV